jgi:DNA-binding transcriptional LysR family regulator
VTQLYFDRPQMEWPLSNGDETIRFPIRAVAVASDPEGLYGFLLAGAGLQLTHHGRVAADVAEGRLVRVLPEWAGPEPALYAMRPSGRIQPPKVKALLDFLVPRLDLKTGDF